MNEIKFRCFYNNKMHDNKEALRILYNRSAGLDWTPSAIIMQCVGGRDINGIDIYAGDIVKYQYLRYRKPIVVLTDVLWQYNGFYIRCNETKLIDSRALSLSHKLLEVVGNIYQNPELIKKESHERKTIPL